MNRKTNENTPVPFDVVSRKIKESGLGQVGQASIREIVELVNQLEKATGIPFIRMEMGVPGLEPPQVGIEAEIGALRNGVASKYPMIDGIEDIKHEMARFTKLFLNIDVSPGHCIPSAGSMQGSMAAFMVSCRCRKERDRTLFIDPGFPVQKMQHHVLGLKYETFDIYNYRGEKLRDKLKSYLDKGNISTFVYSNPNNPSWICFTEDELKIIGGLATEYDVVVMEDLAYFAMDFREDYGRPGIPPYQPTVARYTDNYVLLVSSSKAFSYAGQRVAMMVISDKLFNRQFNDLKQYFSGNLFGHSIVYGALYSMTAGVGHSAQYGMASLLKAANDGNFDFRNMVKVYGERAEKMKRLFIENGFHIVYDRDVERSLADGFYFTISYPGFTGAELLEKLLYYGIGAITLDITGSERHEGLRACVSMIKDEQLSDLEYRLKVFNEHYS